jgi:hypothetical protein
MFTYNHSLFKCAPPRLRNTDVDDHHEKYLKSNQINMACKQTTRNYKLVYAKLI